LSLPIPAIKKVGSKDPKVLVTDMLERQQKQIRRNLETSGLCRRGNGGAENEDFLLERSGCLARMAEMSEN
jgi:hypothetical protein